MKWICLLIVSVSLVCGKPHFACPNIDKSPKGHDTHKAHDSRSELFLETANSTINFAATLQDIGKKKWPMGKQADHKYELPYVLDASVKTKTREMIYYSMVVIERGTNIIFIEYDAKKHKDYLKIVEHKSGGCSSEVGNIKNGMQDTILTPMCMTISDITHELLHNIGLEHEHQRPDRQFPNKKPWNTGGEREIAPVVKPVTIYDPFSIMHYPLTGLNLEPKDGWNAVDNWIVHRTRDFPSPCDFSAVNEMYKGLRRPTICKDATNIRVRAMSLHSTPEGDKKWKPKGAVKDKDMSWACNWASHEKFGNLRYFEHQRKNRKYCQFENNAMYPDLSWIPYAAEETTIINNINNYKPYVAGKKNDQEYPPQHMCDCLGAPPKIAGFDEYKMFQICLECVHFEKTTEDVLHCIAKKSKVPDQTYIALKEGYDHDYHYV